MRKTMQSVEHQTYKEMEYIVVDGASTDGTLQFLAHYQGRLTRWISEHDQGIYDAMNKAIRMATGEWVIFLNAGDTFVSADILTRIFSRPRHADVIYGDVVKGGRIKRATPPHNAHRMYFCHQSCLTHISCLREYPFDTAHAMSADLKLYKQLFKARKSFLQLPLAIAHFDTTGVSNTSRSKGLRDNIQVVREIDGLMDQLRFLPRLYFVYWLCKLRNK